MNNLLRTIFDMAMRIYIEPTVDMAKVKATIYYLEAIKAFRLIVLLICVLLFVLMLFGAGLVVIPMALLLWSAWPPETKLLVSLIVGGLYLILPIIGIAILMSEGRWMRMTRADRLVQSVIHDQVKKQ